MASTATQQVQVHEAGGLQRRQLQAGTAFADLLSTMEAMPEAFLAGKPWLFITKLHVLHLWVSSSPVILGNKNLHLSSERCIMVIKRHLFRFQVHVFEQPLHLLAGECALCQIMYSLAGLF